ncbi:MAG: amidohydrolase [Paucibacter sp.]|nr:amidohydrolase [Roseateles sp.]
MQELLRALPLLAALGLAHAHGHAAEPVLIHNAHGLTLDAQGRVLRFEALLTDADGRVKATGTLRQLQARAQNARRIDAQGRVLMPGLIDAHVHMADLGVSRGQLSLRDTPDLATALAAVRAYAADHADSAWIRGGGWNQAIWKLGRFPTAGELDSAESIRPVWLERVDGHAGWANSRALSLAGITRDTPDPAGGRIERDASGDPTGVLVDGAMELIEHRLPASTPEETRAALAAAQQELLSLGLTGIHDAGISETADRELRDMAAKGTLQLRVDGMALLTDASLIAKLRASGPIQPMADGMYSLRAIKVFADGALGSRGAALLAPYSDLPESRGLLFQNDAELTAQIRPLVGMGFQINVHAIGDAANRQALGAFESMHRVYGSKSVLLRHRIEHAQVIALSDIPRFAKSGVIASVQPVHATSDINMAEDRIGPDRIQGAYAWQRLIQSGARLACGSDTPVEEPTPWAGLYAAITRQDAEGHPPGGWYGAQAMSRTQALACFTTWAAYAAHREDEVGSLLPGHRADFILVDRDPLSVEARGLLHTKVLQTWVGGQLVYASEGER